MNKSLPNDLSTIYSMSLCLYQKVLFYQVEIKNCAKFTMFLRFYLKISW